jgi:hypothetical protein
MRLSLLLLDKAKRIHLREQLTAKKVLAMMVLSRLKRVKLVNTVFSLVHGPQGRYPGVPKQVTGLQVAKWLENGQKRQLAEYFTELFTTLILPALPNNFLLEGHYIYQ